MGAILGQKSDGGSRHNAEALPPIRNRFRFILQHHPFRWYFVESVFDDGGDGWVPSLGRLNITAGVNGIGDNLDTQLAEAGAMRRKWQMIREGDKRLPEADRFYTQKFPTRGKTVVWGSVWDSVKVIAGRAMWRFDAEGYLRFRLMLLELGIVPPLEDDVRDMLIDDKSTQLDRMNGRLAANPNNGGLAGRIERAETLLGKMRGIRPEPEAPKGKGKRAAA